MKVSYVQLICLLVGEVPAAALHAWLHYSAAVWVKSSPFGPIFSGQAWPLEMGPIGCPETSVTDYQSTLRNFPEKQDTIL